MLSKLLVSTTQKGMNLRGIYEVIKNESGLTKAEVAQRTNLNFSTCVRLVEELVERGLLCECGEAKSNGGRKAKKYAIIPDVNYLIGIDISRRFSKVLLLTLDLKLLEERTFIMDESSTPSVIITKITHAINVMLEKRNLSISSVLGIGVSAIGPLDTENGMIKKPLHFPAPGWEDVPITKMLKEYFPTEVVLDYGENTALSAEHRYGAARDSKNVVQINKGIGIRLGLMLNGEILRSRGGAKGGTFGQGHMVVDIHGRKCTCGNYGCMSAYSTIPALVEEVQKQLKRGFSSILTDEHEDISNITFSDIVSAVDQNDSLCMQIVKDTAYYSGAGLTNLITIFHPDKVILNGPMYRELPLFYETSIQTAKQRYKKLFPDLNVSFCRGELDEKAAAIGAGGFVLDSLLSTKI